MIWEWDDVNCIWVTSVFSQVYAVRVNFEARIYQDEAGYFGRAFNDHGSIPEFKACGNLEDVKAACEEFYVLSLLMGNCVL